VRREKVAFEKCKIKSFKKSFYPIFFFCYDRVIFYEQNLNFCIFKKIHEQKEVFYNILMIELKYFYYNFHEKDKVRKTISWSSLYSKTCA